MPPTKSRRLFLKIHMYVGLLNFSILIVFGITGLLHAFTPAPSERKRPQPAIDYRDYTAPEGLDDRQVARGVFDLLRLPLTEPAPYALRRNEHNDLTFTFYTLNGSYRVVVLERENRLRIETQRQNIWHFFNNLHATTIQDRSTDIRVRLWAWYNEVAIWSLIGLPLSGVYLWLTSRPGYKPACYAFAAGCVAFLILYAMTR